MGADGRGRAVAPHQGRIADDARRNASAWRSSWAGDEAARRIARAGAPARPAVRHRRDAHHRRQAHGRGLCRHGAPEERREDRGAGHRAARRLVRPHRAHVAGRCAWSGENGAFYFRMSKGKLHKRFQDDDADARAQPRAPAGDRRAHPRAGSGLRARLGPALSGDRPRDRLLRRRAGAAAGGRGAHRRPDARARADRESQLDPRQRLVRRPTTSWR